MTPDDRAYFLRRADEEERAAEAAASLSARWRHEELAFLYRSRANGYDEPESRPRPREVIANDLILPGDIAL
jgi:hypothetical protein